MAAITDLEKWFAVIFVLGLLICCSGQSTWPEERGLIITTYSRYSYGRQSPVQLRHLPMYPGYESFSGVVPGVNFSNPNTHFLSVDIDYRSRCIYLYDASIRSIVMGTGYNKDLRIKNMTFYPMHVGVSKGTVQVAIDWLSGTLYWSDAAFRWIIAAPGQKDKIDKDYYKIIADKHLDAPDGLTLDPLSGYLFWSDNGRHPKIERSDLKGEQRHTIVSKYLKSPLTLEADISEKRIYWIDSFSETILSATYEGKDITLIQRIPDSILMDLAVFREVIYISDIQNDKVYTLNKTKGIHLGKQESTTIRIFPETIYGLAVYGAENQPTKDKDYCAEKNCEHLCISTKDGAECLCSEGYSLDENSGKCQDTGAAFTKAIVVANATHICLLDIRAFAQASYGYVCKFTVFKHSIQSSSVTPVFSPTPKTTTPVSKSTAAARQSTPKPTVAPLDNITEFDIDMENRLLFFATAGNTIYKRPIDLPIENDFVELVVVATGQISGLAYDAGDSNNLYWCESDTGNIRVVNVVTKASKNTPLGNNSFTKPRDIAVILKHRLLVMITGEERYMSIEAVTVDGKEKSSITRGRLDISSFTFDNENDMFYFIAGRYLYYASYYGRSSSIFLYSVDSNAYNLVQYQNYITWVYPRNGDDVYVKATDLKTKRIITNGMFNNTSVDIVGMKVLDSRLQSTNITSPCAYENGGCSQICITKYVNDTMILTCECRFGYALSEEDGATCNGIAIVEDNFILATDRTNNELLQINLDTDEVSAITDVENDAYKGVHFDEKEKKVIWSENYNSRIFSANLNGTDKMILSDLGSFGYAYRFDKDLTTGNLYFTAYFDTFIGMIAPSGKYLILNNVFSWTTLRDIVVHPGKGWLYFTASGYFSKYIGRADMDGKNIVELITGNHVDNPEGLAIDFINDHLYWSDAKFDTIQRCDLDGQECVTIINMTGTYRDEEIRDLVTDGEFLYYSAYKKDHIVRVDLKEPYNRIVVGQNPGIGKLDTITFYSSKSKNIQPESSACRSRNGLGDCSTICFPTTSGRSCGCENGISLKPDGRTCSNIYQCTDLIEQNVTLSPGKQKVVDITFASSCLRHLDDKCHYKCPNNFEPIYSTLLTCTDVGWNLESEVLCQELRCPQNIANGILDSNCKREVGKICNYQCNKGFTKVTESAVCLDNGTYQLPASELCAPYRCGAQIENGRLDENCTRGIGASCNYSCNKYYSKSIQNLQITCQSDGWNSDPKTLCQESMCIDSSLPNGVVEGDCKKKIGDVCPVQCDRGYVETTDVAVCKSDLMWHPKDSCTPVKCPPNIQNGDISGDCSFVVGATCDFKCSDGFRANNIHGNVTCSATGQWNLNPCIEIMCPSTISNGKLSSDCGQEVGKKCDFVCNDGFIPTTETAVCTENGTYHVQGSKLCIPYTCNDKIEDGALVDGCPRTVGSSCNYTCNKYFTPSVTNMEVVCQADGWSPSSNVLCKESVCEDTSMSNGKVTNDCQKRIGETCTFQCNQGYVNTTGDVVCQDDNLWHPRDMCTVFKCSDSIENGILAADCSRNIGTSCKFRCYKYFSPKVTDMEVTCKADGWSPSSSDLCEESVCQDSSLPNGRIDGKCSKKVGNSCIFQCDEGYVNTTDVAICKSDYAWYPRESCTAIKCSSSMPNGKIIGDCDFSIGATCGFKCNDDFTANKHLTNVTCKSNGQWDVAVDLCFESTCKDSSLHNGQVTGNCLRKVGEACNYKCSKGYRNTTDVTVCKNDYEWHPKMACSQIKCQTIIPNGEITGICDLSIGTSCNFTCNEGFRGTDLHANVTCNMAGEWEVSDNLCTGSDKRTAWILIILYGCAGSSGSMLVIKSRKHMFPWGGSYAFNTVTVVSERLRNNGLSVPGVAVGIVILGLIIIALVVVMALLLRRNRSPKSSKLPVRSGRNTAFENPGYLRNDESSFSNKEEQPSTSGDSTQMQTVFSEVEVPADGRTMDQIYAIEPLPDVAQLEITDDRVVLTQDSWQKEKHQTDSDNC